jgi:GT2 family glycosyltransferase
VTAACMLVRREVFEEVGGFNEKALAVNFNDVDLCLRMRARGWRILWTPYADLVHHESVSRGTGARRAEQELFMREASYMWDQWGAELLHDPFYSPNLRLELPAFYPAFPPRRMAASGASR